MIPVPKALIFLLAFAFAPAGWAQLTVTDICVYGGTSGGIVAAIQAARQGKSVVIVTPGTHLGGMTTGGLSAVDVGNAATIGGIAREFFGRVAARYNNSSSVALLFEPRIADQEFRAMLQQAGVTVHFQQQLATVSKTGTRINEITMESGAVYRAKMFIDTSYEGDLMAFAGVSWTVGRESVATYGETFGGIGPTVAQFQFTAPVDPYVTPGVPASGLIFGVQPGDGGVVGAGDTKLQAFNYRLCLTDLPANRRAVTAPPGYSEATYELLARHIAARAAANSPVTIFDLFQFANLPNRKADVNNNGPISTDFVGANYDYATATPAQREQIALAHRHFIQGMLFFLGNSTRVPATLRAQMNQWGLARDEFTNNDNWPPQLYVRVARRMVSDYVMLQSNCRGLRIAPDSVGLADYTMDSHVVQRFVRNGLVYNEGVFLHNVPAPYNISYRSIVPRPSECDNLFVPWALSSSNVAYGSIRMEPVFMVLSQSSATAACLAIDAGIPVQQIPYSVLSAQLRADAQAIGTLGVNSPDIVVDDADESATTIQGIWTTSTAIPGFIGPGYRHNGGTGSAQKTFRFTPTVPATGTYHVQLRWPSGTNRGSAIPVDVIHSGGTFTTTINQQLDNNVWKTVTTEPLPFDAGTSGSVLIRTQGVPNGQFVIVDAMRLVTARPTLQVVATDGVAREFAPSDTARFTVVRDANQTTAPWTVTYTLSGTATPGTDFSAPTSLIIPAGATSATIPVTAIADSQQEGNESVVLTLFANGDYDLADSPVATVQIADSPQVEIVATDATAREDLGNDSLIFTISRAAADVATAWTIPYSVSGTATPGVDFQAASGSVVIPVGATSATVTITPLDDESLEGSETVTLTLGANPFALPAATGAATGTIIEMPRLQVAATDAAAREGTPPDGATFIFTRAPADAADSWTVNYSIGGTATAGADYATLPANLVIPSGETTATLPIAVVADSLAEGAEIISVTLLAGPQYRPAAPATATATIADQPIDAWRFASFSPAQLALPAISGDEADPDGDLLKNIAEYALGLDPLVPEPGNPQMGWAPSNRLTLSYRQRRSATDVNVVAEGTLDLVLWSSEASMVEEISRTSVGDFDHVEVRLAPVAPLRGFLRVRVTRP